MDLDEFLETLMKTETVSKFPLSMYYSEGTKYLNLFQYETALKFFNEAVEYDPTNFKALLKRSKCLISLRRYKEAIYDADNVLKLFPECVQAIDLKGQAQYLMGDFEGGYLTYSKGREMKPVSNELRLGKQLCEDALNNALHPSLGVQMNQEDIANIAHAKEDHKNFENRLRYRKSRRDYFDADIKFLADLMKDKNLISVHDSCKEAVDFIKHRERFWGMETPLNSRKKRQTVERKVIKKSSEGEKQIQICLAGKRRAENELSKGRIDYCISEARMLLKFTEPFPKHREKEKMKFQCDAYHLLSCAYNKAGNSILACEYLMKELEVAYEFNLLLPRVRAYHQLGESYQLAGNVKEAINCLDKVANADIEKLMKEKTTSDDLKKLYEAMDWANSVINSVKMSVRESVITPIIDSLTKYSELNRDIEFKSAQPVEMEKTGSETQEEVTKLETEFEESSELTKDDFESLIDNVERTEVEEESRRPIRAVTEEPVEITAASKTNLSDSSQEDVNSEKEEDCETSSFITQDEALDNIVNNDDIENTEDTTSNLSANTEKRDGLIKVSISELLDERDDSSRLEREKQSSDSDKKSPNDTVEISQDLIFYDDTERNDESVVKENLKLKDSSDEDLEKESKDSSLQEKRNWDELNTPKNKEESKELIARESEESKGSRNQDLTVDDYTEMNDESLVEENLKLNDSSDADLKKESKELHPYESKETRSSSSQDLEVDIKMIDDFVVEKTSTLNNSSYPETKKDSKELSAGEREESTGSNSEDLAIGEDVEMNDESPVDGNLNLNDSSDTDK